MKNHKLLLLLVLCPLPFFGQQLSGLWTGKLTNDSASIRQDQSFEIILSQYKQKVYGYSRNTFIVNDTLYYIVKRVKGTIIGDVCEVVDDHVVSHNFPKKPEKGVKVTSTFRRNLSDSTWYLDGDWKTSKTKKYYSVSGKVDLKEEKDLASSKLFPHLEELGLDKELPVYAAAVKKSESEKLKSNNRGNAPSTASNNRVNKSGTASRPGATTGTKAPDTNTSMPAKDKQASSGSSTSKPLAATTDQKEKTLRQQEPEPVKQETAQTTSTSSPATIAQKESNPQTITAAEQNRKPETAQTKTTSEPTASIAKNTAPEPVQPASNDQPRILEDLGNTVITRKNTAPPPATNKQPKETATSQAKTSPIAQPERTKEPNLAVVKKDGAGIGQSGPLPVVENKLMDMVKNRKTEAPQFVNFVSDSLVLILYDNGEVDGDTVSVLLNGEMLMYRQGLKTAAIRKTIYITPGQEELTLVLFAENLGRYPPNTGLLVVYDGETRHQLRFSADFQKNASVLFKRSNALN